MAHNSEPSLHDLRKSPQKVSWKTLQYGTLAILIVLLAVDMYRMYQETRPKPPLSAQVENLKEVQKAQYEELQRIKKVSNQK